MNDAVHAMTDSEALGVVVIGRNEGERLVRCLESVTGRASAIVYVDSGSKDGSIAQAEQMGAEVVRLDETRPFSAARARNAGVERLREIRPDVEFVQFVDGDCEVRVEWLEHALRALRADGSAAAVCGRRRERYPRASIYNRLCDLEWDTAIGAAPSCGGDFMVRLAAFNDAGGFTPGIIAGEEPDLCMRLRQSGWTIRRLDCEMTWHDAAMSRFSQWWKRGMRTGYGYAEGASGLGHARTAYYKREARSIVIWAIIVPCLTFAPVVVTHYLSLWVLLAYPLQWGSIWRQERSAGRTAGDSALYAAFVLLAKFAQLAGMTRFYWRRMVSGGTGLLEYK